VWLSWYALASLALENQPTLQQRSTLELGPWPVWGLASC